MPDPHTERKDPPPELDDALILSAMTGSATALAVIYDAYARRIYRYFFSRVVNAAEADDLTAQTFLKVIEALPHYQHRGQFTAWMFQIARNNAMDYFRRNRNQPLDSDGFDLPVMDGALDQVIDQQTVAALRRHLHALDETERELLRLRFVVDLTYVEIATLLGRKEDAVRKAINSLTERLYWQMETNHA
ncbi:MAG: sigma-70 family RNA polymerase sigma factor [Anaerolineaceae bacterium]|nr:sigma-70 family RNA polymerase sigma factor [Anaerolineaceae bacterium]